MASLDELLSSESLEELKKKHPELERYYRAVDSGQRVGGQPLRFVADAPPERTPACVKSAFGHEETLRIRWKNDRWLFGGDRHCAHPVLSYRISNQTVHILKGTSRDRRGWRNNIVTARAAHVRGLRRDTSFLVFDKQMPLPDFVRATYAASLKWPRDDSGRLYAEVLYERLRKRGRMPRT